MKPILYSAIPTSTEMIQKFKKYDFWRWMISIYPWPSTILKTLPRKYAIDNGAYHFHLKNKPYDDKAFFKTLQYFGKKADFVVVPDKVGDAKKTFEMFFFYHTKLNQYKKYFVLQDGMTPADLLLITPYVEGFFVGGTTEWKLKNIRTFSDYAKSTNKKIHIGRVNSIKRIKLCREAGVDSIDGSGFARFRKELVRTSSWYEEEMKQIKMRF